MGWFDQERDKPGGPSCQKSAIYTNFHSGTYWTGTVRYRPGFLHTSLFLSFCSIEQIFLFLVKCFVNLTIKGAFQGKNVEFFESFLKIVNFFKGCDIHSRFMRYKTLVKNRKTSC